MAGYSNAIVVVVALMVFPSMVLAQSSYEVGGDASWGKLHFDYQAWADSITFLVGDSLGEATFYQFTALLIAYFNFFVSFLRKKEIKELNFLS